MRFEAHTKNDTVGTEEKPEGKKEPFFPSCTFLVIYDLVCNFYSLCTSLSLPASNFSVEFEFSPLNVLTIAAS